MKVMVIPIEISALGTILKGLIREQTELEIGKQAETIQTNYILLLEFFLADYTLQLNLITKK